MDSFLEWYIKWIVIWKPVDEEFLTSKEVETFEFLMDEDEDGNTLITCIDDFLKLKDKLIAEGRFDPWSEIEDFACDYANDIMEAVTITPVIIYDKEHNEIWRDSEYKN